MEEEEGRRRGKKKREEGEGRGRGKRKREEKDGGLVSGTILHADTSVSAACNRECREDVDVCNVITHLHAASLGQRWLAA